MTEIADIAEKNFIPALSPNERSPIYDEMIDMNRPGASGPDTELSFEVGVSNPIPYEDAYKANNVEGAIAAGIAVACAGIVVIGIAHRYLRRSRR